MTVLAQVELGDVLVLLWIGTMSGLMIYDIYRHWR
jgi:hypothetical protein